jgi:D-arabinose 1-dehydrogenase-like Zn-dependent alcohol dehydrogenase
VVGHKGVKIATTMGAEVTVLSHSESIREDVLKGYGKNLKS